MEEPLKFRMDLQTHASTKKVVISAKSNSMLMATKGRKASDRYS